MKYSGSILGDIHSISLKNYDENSEELRKALKNHISIYSKYSSQKVDVSEETEKLLNTVSKGRSIRDICLNPLTLRMLFSIYSPYTLPTEINVFKLYSEYWKNRVITDRRPGAIKPSNKENLEKLVCLIASYMLLEGIPIISKEKLSSIYDQLYDHLDLLISRGLISENNNEIEFYHQTFF